MINKKAIKLWVKELRSGNYVQNYTSLQRTDEEGKHSYCCLGVCRKVINDKYNTEYSIGDNFYLGGDLVEFLGIEQGFQCQLSMLNDNDRWTFDQIADYIEEELFVND